MIRSAGTAGFRHYVEAFARLNRAMSPDPASWVEEPGLIGSRGTAESPRGRLLVTDDRAVATLQAAGDLGAGMIVVPVSAEGALAHLRGWEQFGGEPAAAMVAADLAAVPDVALPADLRLRPVTVHEGADGVPLEAAADAAQRADPVAAAMPSDAFRAMLRSMTAAEFLVAVDDTGQVRATSGAIVLGSDARVIFVSTDEAWRGRGVGTAMTATALRSAHRRGATQAALDASPSGRSIYARLGFEQVAGVVLFLRH